MKLQDIIQQNLVQPLTYLQQDRDLCYQVQMILKDYGLLPANGVDGVFGPQTQLAFTKFKELTHQSDPDRLGPGSAKLLMELKELPGCKQLVSKAQAEAIYGNRISDNQLKDLNNCLNRYQINTLARMHHFLSQTAHESGGLRWMKELANGSQYEGRRDLGNTHPGDGPRYKGAGVIQLTGRANYQAFANFIKDPRVMEGCDYVSQVFPFTSAGFFWHRNNINSVIDKGGDIYSVTRIVNGGLNGISDRINYYNRICRIIK